LKYSKIEAKHARIHSAIQAKIWASPFCCAELASARSACTIATKKLPKQIEPKLVVTVRMKLELTADAQQPHSSGVYPRGGGMEYEILQQQQQKNRGNEFGFQKKY
jgi:hypothetical protein